MRRLLALLGSLSLAASSASTVLACSDNTQLSTNTNTPETQRLTDESADSVKSLILEDQYGLDPVKTNNALNVDPNADNITNTPDFNTPDSNVTKNLNLKGMLGKDNAPLYQWNDKLNQLLGKIGLGPFDLSKYFDQWGGVIKQIPYFLNNNDITGLMSLIPTILKNVGQLINVDVDPGSVTWWGGLIKQNIKYIVKSINLNGKLGTMIDNITANTGKCTLTDITNEGTVALENLVNLFFRQAYVPDAGSGDEALSMFLGKDVLTPLLNKQSIDVSKIKGLFTNPTFYMKHITKIVDYATTFLAAIFAQLSFYIPKLDVKDNTTDSLSDWSSTFNKYDAETMTHDPKTGAITLGSDNAKISYNTAIYGTMGLLTNTDAKSLGILKLTNILFHDDEKKENPLLSQITRWLVDSLKFTDYEVKDITTPNDADHRISLNGSNQIALTMDFKLSDLFKKNDLTIAKYYLWVGAFGIGTWTNPADIHLNVTGNGLLDASDTTIEPLLNSILTGSDIKTAFENSVSTLISKNNSVYLTFGGIDASITKLIVGLFEGKIWDKVGGVLTDLLINVWYTDGTKFYAGLKTLGLDDKTIAGIKSKIGDTFPLSAKLLSLAQNTPIGDLTKYAGLINLDTIGNILNILFVTNPFQNPPVSPIINGTTPALAAKSTTTDRQIFTIATANIKDNADVSKDISFIDILPSQNKIVSAAVTNNILTIKLNSPIASETDEQDFGFTYKVDDNTSLSSELVVPGTSDEYGSESLIEQILSTMGDSNKAEEWNYFLGYVDKSAIKGDYDIKSTYVLKDGLIGQLVYQMYPDLDTSSATVPGSLVDATYKDANGKDVTTKAISLRKVSLVKSAVVDRLKKVMDQVAGELQGDDVSDIIDPLINDKRVWKISKMQSKFFNGTQNLQFESYELTFDTSSVAVTHTDRNGTVTTLPTKKATYVITFSRIDDKSTFDFKAIEKLSK